MVEKKHNNVQNTLLRENSRYLLCSRYSAGSWRSRRNVLWSRGCHGLLERCKIRVSEIWVWCNGISNFWGKGKGWVTVLVSSSCNKNTIDCTIVSYSVTCVFFLKHFSQISWSMIHRHCMCLRYTAWCFKNIYIHIVKCFPQLS